MANDKSTYLKNVKHVGIYIRKSRADIIEAETLDKHRTELLTFVNENKLDAQWFEEIVSGTSDQRTEFLRMLDLTKLEVFDALIVINWDRLTRNEIDGARLRKTLQDSETLVIQLSPFEIIDLNNDGDVDKTAFMTFFASMEARTITRRNRAGKMRGALLGKWVNPVIPYGYNRNKKTGYLEIDELQAEVFRRIVEMFLGGMQTRKILNTLNGENIPSPKGGEWNDTVVRLMLIDEVYTGTAIFGKAKYTSEGTKKDKTRDAWVIVPNAHPALLTEEQRNEIINLFSTRKRIVGKAQNASQILSGILKCSVCGGSLHFTKAPKGMWVRKCYAVDGIGTRCGSTDKGVAVVVVTAEIVKILESHKASLMQPSHDEQGAQEATIAKIKRLQADLSKHDKGVIRLLDLYEYGDIDRATYNERKAQRAKERVELERQLATLEASANNVATTAERIEAIDKAVEAIRINDASPEATKALNKELHKIIEKIVYHNDGNTMDLEVHYK